MNGDRVSINVSATDVEGVAVFESKISEKPQFMLDMEYREQIIACAVESLKIACKTIYPQDVEMQSKLANSIAKKIGE